MSAAVPGAALLAAPSRNRVSSADWSHRGTVQRSYAAEYARLWNLHWWWRARERFVLRRLRAAVPTGGTNPVLNVGCGDGLFMDRLREWGEPYGIEPDASLVTEGCSFRDRIEIVPFGPGYETRRRFDLTVMLDVLEHIEDDRGSMERLRSLTTPGGHALLTVPALSSLWSRHDIVNRHFRRYAPRELRAVLEGAGWSVLRLEYFFCWTVLPLYLRGLLFPAPRDFRAAGAEEAEGTVRVPPWPVNRAAQGVSVLEQVLFDRVRPPVGSSILALVRNDAAPERGR